MRESGATVIKIPLDLAHEIDRLAGEGKRSAWAADVLARELRRVRQRQALEASAGVWKPDSHPELSQHPGGAAAAVAAARAAEQSE